MGPIIGGMFVLGAALALIFYMRRQRRNQGVRVTIDGDEPRMSSHPVTSTETHLEPYTLGRSTSRGFSESNSYLMESLPGRSNNAPTESNWSSFDGYDESTEPRFNPQLHVSPPAYSEVDSSATSFIIPNPHGKS